MNGAVFGYHGDIPCEASEIGQGFDWLEDFPKKWKT